jgi:hypothetical protein
MKVKFAVQYECWMVCFAELNCLTVQLVQLEWKVKVCFQYERSIGCFAELVGFKRL